MISVRAPVGEVNIADKSYGIGRGLCAIEADKIEKNYLWFLVKVLRKELYAKSTGSTYDSVSTDDIKSLFCLLPPENEQKAIASYLDKETKRIDSLINKKEKLIELLEEKRQTVISQAVTKGLNSDVSMKDSGVDWVGKIPKHWKVTKVKYLGHVTKLAGYEFTNHVNYDENGDIIALRALNVKIGKLNLNNIKRISTEVDQKLQRSQLNKGDIVFTYVGTVGEVALITESNKYHLAPNVAKITLYNNDPKFYLYYFRSNISTAEIEISMNITSQPVLSMEKIRNINLVLPPIEEQNKIENYLEDETRKIDDLIDKIKTQILNFKEYRKTLITKAVTGKIDVRELV